MPSCKGGVCSRSSRATPQMAQQMGLPAISQAPKSSFFKGTPAYNQTFSTLTPQQSQLQNQALQGALGLLQGGAVQPFSFAPIENEARTNFFESTIPTLAERFTSMGGQNSSAFQGALGRAGSDLERGLAALKSQYGLQQQGMKQNLLANLLSAGLGTRAFDTAHFQRQPGFFENLFSSAAPAAIKLGGSLLL